MTKESLNVFSCKYALGQSVWSNINGGREFVAVIHSITFHKDGIIAYGLHSEEFPWPESYLTIPEKGIIRAWGKEDE